jgi:hypothetical protein
MVAEIRQVEQKGCLLVMVPFYSIESWLFMNESAVRNLVRSGKASQADLSRLERLLEQKQGLDEVLKPKEIYSFGSRYNLSLCGSGLNAGRLAAQSDSFAALLTDWARIPGLPDLLRRTCPWAAQ